MKKSLFLFLATLGLSLGSHTGSLFGMEEANEIHSGICTQSFLETAASQPSLEYFIFVLEFCMEQQSNLILSEVLRTALANKNLTIAEYLVQNYTSEISNIQDILELTALIGYIKGLELLLKSFPNYNISGMNANRLLLHATNHEKVIKWIASNPKIQVTDPTAALDRARRAGKREISELITVLYPDQTTDLANQSSDLEVHLRSDDFIVRLLSNVRPNHSFSPQFKRAMTKHFKKKYGARNRSE